MNKFKAVYIACCSGFILNGLLDVPFIKIGSGEITWLEQLEYIASKGIPVMLATGDATMSEIDEATDRVLMGPAKTSRKVTEYEKKIVSYHEAGHAVSGIILPNGEEVHKITIIPRGMAGGYTQMLPKEERTLVYTKKDLEEQIVTLLAGRAAEEHYLDEISTGASDDLKRATKIARSMVTKYGMSEKLGAITFGSGQEEVFLGRDFAHSKEYSEETAGIIDEEVKKIILEVESYFLISRATSIPLKSGMMTSRNIISYEKSFKLSIKASPLSNSLMINSWR